MNRLTHDTAEVRARSRASTGLVLAVVSAASFGLSGPLGRGLMDAGWSPAAAVAARVAIASLALAPWAVTQLRGRWGVMVSGWRTLLVYGLVPVAGCQLAFFNAVLHLDVGVALLVEYTAPVAIVVFLWLRHGQRPHRLTVVGAAVAAAGLVLVLDLLGGGGVSLSAVGLLWALGAMVGAATYFVMSSDESHGIPAAALASGGLAAGAVALTAAGVAGLVPFSAATADLTYRGTTVPWWGPVLALGVLTAAVAYLTGIEASRRLGSRLASFIALSEVLAGLLWAWLLLDQLPQGIQLVGGALVVVGVVVVKAGEPAADATPEPVPEATAPPTPHGGA
ncbi:MAG: DMT family transporter [Actinomycetales bacterium]|nr:MAG: DMT family transporter [Actinomycetales bacterium]